MRINFFENRNNKVNNYLLNLETQQHNSSSDAFNITDNNPNLEIHHNNTPDINHSLIHPTISGFRFIL